MRKRAILVLIAVAVVAVAIIAYVLLRRTSPPSTVKLLPPADAYLYFDVATVRRASVLSNLPQVEFEPEYAEFVRQTGFNLEKDLDEAAFALQHSTASTTNPEQPEWRDTGVFVASFDRGKMEAYFKKIATAGTETYRNTIVYVVPLPGRTVRVAILDKRTVAASNTDGPYVIQGIIDRHAQFSGNTPDLIHAHYADIPWGSLAWAIARPPSTAGGNARLELPGGLGIFLPPETVVVASLRYLGSVDFRAQAFATSNDAAQRIADQLDAFLALFRALESGQARGSDKDVKGFFESIRVTLDRNRAEMQATVPAGFVKKMIANAPAAGIDAQPSNAPAATPPATQPKASRKSPPKKK